LLRQLRRHTDRWLLPASGQELLRVFHRKVALLHLLAHEEEALLLLLLAVQTIALLPQLLLLPAPVAGGG
jgi:hypothetical protein